MSADSDECYEIKFDFWQDREIRFDGPHKTIDLRGPEEVLIRVIHRVEDTKGNNGVVGTMMMTNLRLIWYATSKSQTNLSIGYNTVRNLTVKEADSKLGGGLVSSLFVTAKFGSSRFQFVFTSTGEGGGAKKKSDGAARENNNLFSLAHMAWKAYEATKMYREVRLRSAIVANPCSGAGSSAGSPQLLLLPQEKVRSQYQKFLNITKEESFVGRLILTNIRLVWIEDLRPSFNVSVPFLQIVAVRLQRSSGNPHNKVQQQSSSGGVLREYDSQSKKLSSTSSTAKTMVVQSSSYGGNFKFGFCAMQPELTKNIFTEVRSLWQLGVAHPVLGVEVEALATSPNSGSGETQAPPTSPPARPPSVSASTASALKRHHGPGGDAVTPLKATPPAVPLHRGGGSSSSIPTEGANDQVFEEAPKDSFAAYYADDHPASEREDAAGASTSKAKSRVEPVYDVSMGLAIEPLRKGTNLRDLWKVAVK